MSKVPLAAALCVLLPAMASAAVLGPDPAACERGGGRPAMLVRVIGLKNRAGTIRVQAYGDPATFFEKGRYLRRIEVAAPAAGPVEVCVPVARAGIYAISVRHDVNGSGKSDLSDGGGMSGNPNMSLMDVVFKRRPAPERVAVRVAGLTEVPVVMNYLQGGSVRPLASAGR